MHEYKVTNGKGSVVVLFRDLDYTHLSQEPDKERGESEEKKFAGYILPPDVRPTSEIKHHHDTAPGDRYVFIDQKKLPEADFYTIVRTAKDVQSNQVEYIDRHSHNCDSYYLFIGDNPDLTGVQAEVAIGDKISQIESPTSVYIPQGILHHYRLTGGSGKFFSIVPKGNYNESLL